MSLDKGSVDGSEGEISNGKTKSETTGKYATDDNFEEEKEEYGHIMFQTVNSAHSKADTLTPVGLLIVLTMNLGR